MKFLIMRMADTNTEAGVMPSDELLMAMGQYNQALADAGLLVDGMGLMPTSKGSRISFNKGVPSITDGPFTESKELLAGFTLIQTRSKQEALDWAIKWPQQDGDGNTMLHLRQVFEMDDFVQGGGIATHEAVADTLKKQPGSMCVYLGFDGKCREAFEFYAVNLGGHIQMMSTNADAPAEICAQMTPGSEHRIMHARMQVGPYQIMGSDVPQGMYQKPSGFHLQIGIDDLEQAEITFARLAEGGTVQMPLCETFWAQGFGMVTDRFGTPWMINSNYKIF